MPLVTQSSNTPLRNSTGKENYQKFDYSGTNPRWEEGTVFYDSVSHSYAYYNDSNGVTVNLGQEELVRVYNNTGSGLVDGQMVYITGASGGFPSVTLAKADAEVSSQSTLGMVTNAISNGAYGYITTSGIVHDINTNAYTAGTVLYLSETTAGAYTSTPPLQPSYVVEIGTVTEQGLTTGAIYVHIDKKPWSPSIELLDSTASVTLPTTPTVIALPTTVKAEGFTYNSGTGVFTFNESGDYSLTFLLNALPSASNKNVYFYLETSYNGGSWTPSRYSARMLRLVNAVETQLLIAGSKYFPKLTSMRFYLWGDATVTLKTTDLPGTTAGTVTLPAARIMIA